MNGSIEPDNQITPINDTLYNLLRIEYRGADESKSVDSTDLAYLIRIKLHHSAYNILADETHYELAMSEASKLKMIESLDTVNYYEGAWFEDDTK